MDYESYLEKVRAEQGMAAQGRHEWDAPGHEFLDWRARTQDWLGAEFCSFWWD